MNHKFDLIIFDLSDILLNSYITCLNNAKAVGNINGLSLVQETIRSCILRSEKIVENNLNPDGYAHIVTSGLNKLIDLRRVANDVKVKSRDTEGYFEAIALIIVDILLAKGSQWSVAESWILKELPFYDTNKKVLIISENVICASFLNENIFLDSRFGIINDKGFKEHYGFIPEKEKIITYKSFLGRTETDSRLNETLIGNNIRLIIKVLETLTTVEEIERNIYSVKGLSIVEKDLIRELSPTARMNRRILIKDNTDDTPESGVVFGKKDEGVLKLWDDILYPSDKDVKETEQSVLLDLFA